ncbi:MAG: HigA family addiction module antitoxin [Thermomicrobiales bacterium]
MSFLPLVHSGEVLAEELELRGVTATDLSRALGVQQSRISNILRERTGITAETALRLGRWSGTGPELWLNLQKQYELRKAMIDVGAEIERVVVPARDA